MGNFDLNYYKQRLENLKVATEVKKAEQNKAIEELKHSLAQLSNEDKVVLSKIVDISILENLNTNLDTKSLAEIKNIFNTLANHLDSRLSYYEGNL